MKLAGGRGVPWGLLTATIAAFAILIALGTWQLHRRDIKRDLITRIEARLAEQPVDLAVALDDWRRGDNIDFRRVRVAGRYRSGSQLRQFSISEGRQGWQLVAVLDSDTGPPVLVDRGFVREGLETEAPLPGGPVEITGNVRLRQAPQALFAPDNDPARNMWFWWDVAAMAKALGVAPGEVPAIAIQRNPQAGDPEWPRAAAPDVAAIPDNHMQYALTWYALAIVLIIMAFIFARGRYRTSGMERDE